MNEQEKSKFDEFLKGKEERGRKISIDEIIERLKQDPMMARVFEEEEKKKIEREASAAERKRQANILKDLDTKGKEALERLGKGMKEADNAYNVKKKELDDLKKESERAGHLYKSERTRQELLRNECKSYLTRTAPKELSRAGKTIYKLIDKEAYRDAIHSVYRMTPQTIPEIPGKVYSGYTSDVSAVSQLNPFNQVTFSNEPRVNDLGERLKKAYQEFLNDMCSIDAEKMIEKWRTRGEGFQREYEQLKAPGCKEETIHPRDFMKRYEEYKKKYPLHKGNVNPIKSKVTDFPERE